MATFTEELKQYSREHPLNSVLKKSDANAEQLAAYFEVSTKSVYNWLLGNTRPKKAVLEEMDRIKEKLEAELPESAR